MKRRTQALYPLMLAAMLFAGGRAWAETSPYYIGVTQAFSYDSNVYRLPDAFAQGSSWGSTGLVAGLDQYYRRQHFFGSANVQTNNSNELSDLNNTSYAVNGGWHSPPPPPPPPPPNVAFSEGLGNYGGANDTLIRERNIQRSTSAFATANYGLVSLVSLNARLGYSRVSYSAPQFARYELEQQTATLGVRKQFSGQLTLGTGLTYTNGSYFSTGRDFDRYDVFVSGRWLASGLSTLSGRLNYSHWDYTGFRPYTTDGATGWLRWDYAPTGKLNFNVWLSYDTVANSGLTDFGGGPANYLGDTSQLTSAVHLGATYQATAKIQLNANIDYFRRNNDTATNFPNLPVNIETRDQVTALVFGATWTPTRNWLIACNLNSHTRNQSSPQPITLTPYDAWGASCSAQFALQ